MSKKSVKVPAHLQKEVKLSEITDKTDFFMVLDGQCYLTFQVKIQLDQSDTLKYIQKKAMAMDEG